MSWRFRVLSLPLSALIAFVLVAGAAGGVNVRHAGTQAVPSAACPRNSTTLSFQGGCGGYDVYVVGFTDATGYHIVDANDMILTGCSGGHLVCNGPCKYVPQETVHAAPPRFSVDMPSDQVYWDNYDIEHGVADQGCGADKQNCYLDVNEQLYIGREGYQNYSCSAPSGLLQ